VTAPGALAAAFDTHGTTVSGEVLADSLAVTPGEPDGDAPAVDIDGHRVGVALRRV
jgi:hypothetical protein